MLSHDNGNEYSTNIWWFGKIVLWILDVFMEYGIEVEIVSEDYTSQRCSICGIKHRNRRIYEDYIYAEKQGRKSMQM